MLISCTPFKLTSQTYAQLVLADGASGYWRLGETAGVVLIDSSPNLYDGEHSGVQTFGVAGISGAGGDFACQYPGTTTSLKTQVSLSGKTNIDLSTNYTFECWIKTSAATQNMGVFAMMNAGSNSGRGIFISSANLSVGVDGVGRVNFSAPTIANNAFHHLAVTYSGTAPSITIRGFFDGAPIGSTTGTDVLSHAFLVIAAFKLSTGTFNGVIDECAIYPTVLSDAAILSHYNKGIA